MSPLKPQTSETIAGYRLIERIGAGGYGEVWKAEAPGGLEKAVKLIYGYLDDQRAACELKALQRIKEARHPFLLSVERIEVIDGQLVVVTELADMSLKDRFENCRAAGRPGIPRQELLVYMGDAADALDYMRESHGLQHLDVKPENLLITSGRVKVADFGLVKSIRDEHVSLLGGLTPQYAPPELFDGSPSLSSDQYSLAIVYQEMLTGTPPFPGRTAAQLASQHLHSQPQLLSLKTPDREVIARALSKQPSARFASSRQMVDALRAADRGQEAASLGVAVEKPPPDAAGDTNSIRGQQTQPAESRAEIPDADGLVPPRREPTVPIGRQPGAAAGRIRPVHPAIVGDSSFRRTGQPRTDRDAGRRSGDRPGWFSGSAARRPPRCEACGEDSPRQGLLCQGKPRTPPARHRPAYGRIGLRPPSRRRPGIQRNAVDAAAPLGRVSGKLGRASPLVEPAMAL